MAVPKRRTSKSSLRSRRASQKATVTTSRSCPDCGAPRQTHRVCPNCGMYRGRQVVTVEVS